MPYSSVSFQTTASDLAKYSMTGHAVGVTTAPQIFQLISVRRASDPKVNAR